MVIDSLLYSTSLDGVADQRSGAPIVPPTMMFLMELVSNGEFYVAEMVPYISIGP